MKKKSTKQQGKNSEVGYKHPPKDKQFKSGAPSPNPKGRPKNEASITYWLNKFQGMSPLEVAEACEVYAKEFRKFKGEMTTASIIAARALLTLMNETEAKVFATILDRTDGKLVTPIATMTWKEYLEQQGLDAAAVFNGLVAAAAAAEHDAARTVGADADRSASGGAGKERSNNANLEASTRPADERLQ